MTRRQAGIAHASAGSAGRVQSRPCPPPPPRLPPPRSPPPRSGRSPPRSSCRCGGAGRWPAARWPAARGRFHLRPRCRSLCMGCARLSGPRSCRCMRGCGACSRTCGGAWTCGRGGCASRPCGGAARSFGRGPGPPGFWSGRGAVLVLRKPESLWRSPRGPAPGLGAPSGREPAPGPGPCSMKARGGRPWLCSKNCPRSAPAERAKLRGGGRDVGFVARGGLARVGHAPDAVRTAVVADAAVVDVVDHYVVRIHVGDMRDVHIGHRAVVEVAVVVPVAAHETDADITEAVVDAAVEADVRPPVAGVPQIDAVHETPVARRPQRAGIRRQHQAPGTQK